MDIYSKLPDFSGIKLIFFRNSKEKLKLFFLTRTIFSNKVKFFFFFFAVSGVLFLLALLFLQESQKTAFSFEQDQTFQEMIALSDGNTLMPVSDISNPERQIVKKIRVIVTAYSSTPWETWGDPFITAAGTRVKKGIIANNLLPFGTKVRLPEIYGEKVFVVEDRMHSRKGNYHFDIWFPSHYEAKAFGAKITYVEVLSN